MIQDHELSALELEAKLSRLQRGQIGPPPGNGLPEYRNRLNGLLSTAVEAGERLLRIGEALHAATGQTQGLTQSVTNHAEAIRAIGEALSAVSEALVRIQSRLAAVEARVIPQIPSEHGIRWSNLWRALTFVPGTAKARMLLTLWEFGMWGPPAVGALMGWEWLGWAGAVSGWLMGAGFSFVAHEWFFALYGEKVARVPLLDEGEPSGIRPSVLAPLERWSGPTA